MNKQNKAFTGDEFSLVEIIIFLKKFWIKITLGGLIGGLLGLGFAMSTSTYQANTFIQIAKVAGVEIEAANLFLAKLKLGIYFSSKSIENCNVKDAGTLGKVLTAKIVPDTSIINISYKSANADLARNCLEAVLVDIKTKQYRLFESLVEVKKNQLDDLKESSMIIKKAMNNFSIKSDKNFYFENLMLIKMISQTSIETIYSKIYSLEVLLSDVQTKESHLTSPIEILNRNTVRKTLLAVLSFVFIGIILVIGFLLLRIKWLKYS